MKNKKSDDIKFICSYLKKYKSSIFIVFIISVSISLTQSIPLKITEILFDIGFANNDYKLILVLAILFFIVNIAKIVLTYFMNKKTIILGQKIISGIKKDIYKKIMQLSIDYYNENNSGYLNARINEIDSISQLFSPIFFDVIISFLSFTFISIILMSINLKIYIILLIPLPFMIIASYITTRTFLKKTEDVLEHSSLQYSMINERLKGIEQIKLSGKEDNELRKLSANEDKLKNKTIDHAISFQQLSQCVSFFSVVAPTILYIVGGKMYVDGLISLGTIFTFSLYINKIYAPFLNITSVLIVLEPALLSINRMRNKFFNQEINTKENDCKFSELEKINSIEFKEVSYSYKKNSPLLCNVNFKLYEGEALNIKGENGSGKSTLLRLLLRLISPDNGSILINNINYNSIDVKDIRNSIGVISQKIFLFDDTIKNNILYLSNEYNKNYEEIFNLLKISNIYLKRKCDENMHIGENGSRLSGGEIQKIAIARALLSNANLLIFDEANSNIDSETKITLRNIIKKELAVGKIVIIIDHNNDLEDICVKKIYL